MRTKKFTFLSSVVLFASIMWVVRGLPVAHAENENELRANEVLLAPLCDVEGIGEIILRVENSDRWKDDFDDHFYHKNEFSLRVPIPSVEGLNWESGYRRRSGEVGGENTYLFNLTWNKAKICGTDWELRFRNQWELNDPDGSSDQSYKSRFRFLFVRDLPWIKSAGHPWKLGLGDEVFWKPEEGVVDENQLGGGIQVPLSDQAVIQFGAVWQRLESTGVESGHDDNLLLNISFQYHLPSRAKREAKRPIFNENLQKEF